MTHTNLGNLIALVVICFFATAGYFSIGFGAIGYLALAYLAWAVIWLLTFFATPKADALSRFSFSAAEANAYRRYYLYRWYPGAAEACSAFLNSIRLAGLVWAGVCFWNRLPGAAIALIVYFFVVAGFVVRLNPRYYLVPGAQDGDAAAIAQLALIESVQKKCEAYSRGSTEHEDS